MTSTDQARSIEEFERRIFPLWRGIEERALADDKAMDQTEADRSPVMFECLTRHKQDLAIYNSQIRPSTTAAEPPADFRRRAAAADRFSSWKEGE